MHRLLGAESGAQYVDLIDYYYHGSLERWRVVSVFLEARRGMVRLELATRLADVREQALLEAAKNAALCP